MNHEAVIIPTEEDKKEAVKISILKHNREISKKRFLFFCITKKEDVKLHLLTFSMYKVKTEP